VDEAELEGRFAELRPLTVPLLGRPVSRRQQAAVVAASLLPELIGVREVL
jgi:hypothetical protein